MNYIFNVLWFEDNAGWFKLEKLELETIVERHCLECNIVRERGVNFDISRFAQEEYDLILMDYDLASNLTGEKIIGIIRDANIYTDILFYSSQYDVMVDSIKNTIPPIDGIYYSSRKIESFHDKLSRLTSKIVQRSENLINLRGFVLDNTSDFELRIKEILNICWQKFDPDQRTLLTGAITNLIDGKVGRITKQTENAKKQVPIFTFSNNNDYILSISDRLDVLQVVLPILFEQYEMPAYICPSNFKKHYIDNINMYRNRLGHIKLGEKTIKIQGNDIEINQEFHRLLRKNISSMESTLSKVEEYLMSNI